MTSSNYTLRARASSEKVLDGPAPVAVVLVPVTVSLRTQERVYCPQVWLKGLKLVGWARCVNTAIYESARVPESSVTLTGGGLAGSWSELRSPRQGVVEVTGN